MGRWIKQRTHVWPDEHGNPVLRHTKYLTPRGDVSFPWQHRIEWPETGIVRWFDGDGKDDGIVHPLLYRRDLFTQADRREHVFICEGEKDADSLTAAGVLAVTAGGVYEFKRDHARLFKGWQGRVTIVRDNDLPGAYGAARTFGLLLDAGTPRSRLRVARGRVKSEGADAHDHLAAGYTVDQFVPESIANVRRLAAKATPAQFARAGYGDWMVVGADESAQLKGWKPGRAS